MDLHIKVGFQVDASAQHSWTQDNIDRYQG